MALLATLEGLGVPTRKNGGIFGACLGACDSVGATVAGCLGDYLDLSWYEESINTQKANGTYNKIDRRTISDKLTGLGEFDFPIFYFNQKYNLLKRNSPTTSPEALAASVYFAMLAGQPVPTTENQIYYVGDYDIETDLHGAVKKEDWYLLEDLLSNGSNIWGLNFFQRFVKQDNAQNAYYYKLKQLQQYLQSMGLWAGIQKTLNEESRKLQSQAAAASASAAAAAKALAMARINADISQEGRFEAAKQQAEADYKKALENEEKIKQALKNVSEGLPAGTPNLPDTKTKETSIWPVLGLATAAAFAFMG